MCACKNTNKEIWRKESGSYYGPSIFVTEDERIGINVGGRVIVASVYKWHKVMSLAMELILVK